MGSLSLCGAVHCELPWEVLKTSLVYPPPPAPLPPVEKEEEEERGEGAGAVERRVFLMFSRRAHV